MIGDFTQSSDNLLADRRFDYARRLMESGDLHAAYDLLRQTLELAPAWPALLFTLGDLCAQMQRREEALEWYGKSIALDPPDRLGALVKMQTLGAPVRDSAMPRAFVETLFDQYAGRYDAHLTEALAYDVPRFIHDFYKRLNPAAAPARILDLGCGTGLAGEYFAPHAQWLEGVDLSKLMLARAAQKNIYHKLTQDDLTHYLQNTPDSFDLMLAADVLMYLGPLEPVFAAAKPRIAPDGGFIFSVQKLAGENPDFHLDESRRYYHSHGYITRALAASGLSLLACEEIVLRKDRRQDVMGVVYLCTA